MQQRGPAQKQETQSQAGTPALLATLDEPEYERNEKLNYAAFDTFVNVPFGTTAPAIPQTQSQTTTMAHVAISDESIRAANKPFHCHVSNLDLEHDSTPHGFLLTSDESKEKQIKTYVNNLRIQWIIFYFISFYNGLFDGLIEFLCVLFVPVLILLFLIMVMELLPLHYCSIKIQIVISTFF